MGKHKIMVMGPNPPATKKECAGESQQQFTRNPKVWLVAKKIYTHGCGSPNNLQLLARIRRKLQVRQANRASSSHL
jgi:hypothetical protein